MGIKVIKPETYKTKYYCGNCRKYFKVILIYGKLAPESVTCSKCGCHGSRKAW